jgi:hypothetical protein
MLCRVVAGEPAADVRALGWMAGAWFGDDDGIEIEEHWLPPKGGMLLGLHRDVAPSGKAFFEYLRVVETPEGVVYMASPSGREATPFRLIETGERRAVFENPEHDFPQRILYWIDGETLHARIEGDTTEGVKSREWSYRRGGAGR